MKTFDNKINLNLESASEVSLKGFIAPIEDMDPNFHEEWEALANLQVAEPEKGHSTSVFRAFLPNEPVSVGDYWQIDDEGALALLKQFQPNPNLDMHINAGDSCGLWACLRAYNDEFADIVFRIHAAFALTDGWFTPSQLAGHLFIDRIKESVASFQMRVPEGTLFDVNWKKNKDDPNYFYTAGGGVCPMLDADHRLTFDPYYKRPEGILLEESHDTGWLGPNETGQMTHHFECGQIFKLVALGWASNEKESINAFYAKISVEASD